MPDRVRQQLQDQLQAGVHLVHTLLTQTDLAALAKIKPLLLRDLKRWAYLLPGHIPKIGPHSIVRCGPLRREPDECWWWDTHFLGKDGDAEASLLRPEDEVRLVVVRVGDALEDAVNALGGGDPQARRRAQRVLSRYSDWQSTQVWEEA